MKKLYKIIILIHTTFAICFSQSGWIQQNSGINSNLYSVHIENPLTGWCVGNGGKILKTTNGGNNWIQQLTGYLNDLRSITFSSVNIGYIVGDSGLILKTNDGGANWSNLSFRKGLLNSLFFVNDKIGYTGGEESELNPNTTKIFKTTNGGVIWDSNEVTVGDLKSICFIDEFTGWISGKRISGDAVLKTTNGGLVWDTQFYPGNSDNIRSVFFIDSLNGWLSGRSNFGIPTIFRTTNGGVNWITVFPGTGTIVNSLFFVNKNNGWAAGENRIIQATTNGGINWTNQTSYQPGINYNSVYFTDSLTGWVVGDSGKILKTTTGGIITGINNTSSEIPDRFSLSQNFPNPFNPNTIINYELRITSYVSLKVYDVLGNEVATLVNEKQNPGSYNYQFSTVNYQLASGIYFYTLTAGDFTETKRMVLIK